MKKITPHLYQISLGSVNVFIVEDGDLTLIDTGNKDNEEKIFSAMRKGGLDPSKVKRIIVTHAHPDHIGSLAAIANTQKVEIIAHPEDAKMIEQGLALRPTLKPAPRLFYRIICRLFLNPDLAKVDPVRVTQLVNDGDILPIAGGLTVIHSPGHSAGHIALLYKEEDVLIAGDICGNVIGLGYSVVYEDYALGMQSILKVASFKFEKAVFGHGGAIMKSANKKMKEKFQDKV